MKDCCDELIELIALAVILFTLTAGGNIGSVHQNHTPSHAPVMTFVEAHPRLLLPQFIRMIEENKPTRKIPFPCSISSIAGLIE